MLLHSEAFEIKLNSNTINIIDDWYVDFKINTSSSSSSMMVMVIVLLKYLN